MRIFYGWIVAGAAFLAWAISPVFAALLTDRLQGPRLGFLLGLQNIGFGAAARCWALCPSASSSTASAATRWPSP